MATAGEAQTLGERWRPDDGRRSGRGHEDDVAQRGFLGGSLRNPLGQYRVRHAKDLSWLYTLWVDSKSTDTGDETIVDGRNTRFGIDVLGPRIPMLGCAESGGKIEIDFQGAFNGTDNKGSVLLRHAYVEVKNDDFRLLAGQTWDVISPLNPSMLMYSVGRGRRQYRLPAGTGPRRTLCGPLRYRTADLSRLHQRELLPDSITGVTGDPSSWPIIEGRRP